MKVKKTAKLESGHQIEFGSSTWDKEQLSVRNRYETRTGGFSPHSSSELPLNDVVAVSVETLKRDYLGPEQTMAILQAAVDSIRRQLDSRDDASRQLALTSQR